MINDHLKGFEILSTVKLATSNLKKLMLNATKNSSIKNFIRSTEDGRFFPGKRDKLFYNWFQCIG